MAKKRNSDYRVGYRKPPKHAQFKPGQSGNPSGRPKKTKTLSELLAKIDRMPVTISEGGKRRQVPTLVASLMQCGLKSAAGDMKALRLYLGLHADRDTEPQDSLLQVEQTFRAIYQQREADERARKKDSKSGAKDEDGGAGES